MSELRPEDVVKVYNMSLKDAIRTNPPSLQLDKTAEMALEALMQKGEHHPKVYQAAEALRQALNSTKFLPEEMDAYERGFIEGRQYQMRSTVERAVNAMTKREWVGLTEDEKYDVLEGATGDGGRVYYDTLFRSYEAKLKEKNV